MERHEFPNIRRLLESIRTDPSAGEAADAAQFALDWLEHGERCTARSTGKNGNTLVVSAYKEYLAIIEAAGHVQYHLAAELPKLVAELKTAVTAAAQEDGWAFIGTVGSYLNNNDPAFDSRNYRYKKLRDLVHAQSCLEIDERRADPESPISQIYVRLKAS